jgi:hypothetical protein
MNYRNFLVSALKIKPLRMYGDDDGSDKSKDKDKGDDDFRQRRQKELEGITLEAAKNQIIQFGVDSKKYRDKIRELEGQIGAGQKEKEELEAYRKFGKPEDLGKTLEQAAKDSEGLLELQREKVVTKAAALPSVKFKPEALAEVVKLYKLEVSIETESVTKEGKTESVEVAKVKAADGKLVPLTDYANAHLKHFLPSLANTDGAADSGKDGVPQDGGKKGTPPSGPFANLQQQQADAKVVQAFDFKK